MRTYPKGEHFEYQHDDGKELTIFSLPIDEIEWKDVAAAPHETTPIWEVFTINCKNNIKTEVYGEDGELESIFEFIGEAAKAEIIEILLDEDDFISRVGETFANPGLDIKEPH